MQVPLAVAALAALFSATFATFPAQGPARSALTLTGCLRDNPMLAGAYLLESVEGDAGAKSYRLTGSSTADLKPHVGKKVKVTGTVSRHETDASAVGDATAKPMGDPGPWMEVTSISKVAASCPGPVR